MMVISKYAFWDESGKYDGARIAAQIVSGIGFLGAGMIVYSKGTLHGLTTAAGIWATAGVGMSIGAGGQRHAYSRFCGDGFDRAGSFLFAFAD